MVVFASTLGASPFFDRSQAQLGAFRGRTAFSDAAVVPHQQSSIARLHRTRRFGQIANRQFSQCLIHPN